MQVEEVGSGLFGQILSSARPVAVDVGEGTVEVGFPGLARRSTSARPRRRRHASGVADAVRTIVGERLRPVYVLLDDERGRYARGRRVERG